MFDIIEDAEVVLKAGTSEGAIRAWETRRAQGEGIGGKIDSAVLLNRTLSLRVLGAEASTAADAVSSAKTPRDAVDALSRLHDRLKRISDSAGSLGSGQVNIAGKNLSANLGQISGVIDSIRTKGVLDDLSSGGLMASVHQNLSQFSSDTISWSNSLTQDSKKNETDGLIVGTGAATEVNRRHYEFHGGPSMMGMVGDLKRRMDVLGYGKVEEVLDDKKTVRELWEHPDGRAIFLSHKKEGDAVRVSANEFPKDRWRDIRRKFVSSYSANRGLLAPGAKPAKPVAGSNVGRFSEVPFRVTRQPKEEAPAPRPDQPDQPLKPHSSSPSERGRNVGRVILDRDNNAAARQIVDEVFSEVIGKAGTSVGAYLAWETRRRESEASSRRTGEEFQYVLGHPAELMETAHRENELRSRISNQKALGKYKVPKEYADRYMEAMKFRSERGQKFLTDVGLTAEQVYDKIDDARNQILSGTPSIVKHTLPDGTWTPERTRVHEKVLEVIRKQFAHIKPSKDPKALLKGGLPASGKSSSLKLNEALKSIEDNAVRLDNDAIKDELAKEDGLPKSGITAELYHEEADYLLKILRNEFLSQGKSLSLDMTMKSYEKTKDIIDSLAKGSSSSPQYQVVLAYSDVPFEEAIYRSLTRAFGPPPQEGRYVDPACIAAYDGHPRENFTKRLKNEGNVAGFIQVNNFVPLGKPPEVMSLGGVLTPIKPKPVPFPTVKTVPVYFGDDALTVDGAEKAKAEGKMVEILVVDDHGDDDDTSFLDTLRAKRGEPPVTKSGTSEGAIRAWESRHRSMKDEPTKDREIVHLITQEDQRRAKQERYPSKSRLPLFLEAYDRAKTHPKGLMAGIRANFEHSPLREKMLRVLESPKDTAKSHAESALGHINGVETTGAPGIQLQRALTSLKHAIDTAGKGNKVRASQAFIDAHYRLLHQYNSLMRGVRDIYAEDVKGARESIARGLSALKSLDGIIERYGTSEGARLAWESRGEDRGEAANLRARHAEAEEAKKKARSILESIMRLPMVQDALRRRKDSPNPACPKCSGAAVKSGGEPMYFPRVDKAGTSEGAMRAWESRRRAKEEKKPKEAPAPKPAAIPSGGDPTEAARREMVNEINAEPGSRAALEAAHGEVLDTQQLSAKYEVQGFMAPFVVARRKSDGAMGSLTFQHQPRFYFGWLEDKK